MSQLQIGEPDSRTHHTQPSTGSGAKIAGQRRRQPAAAASFSLPQLVYRQRQHCLCVFITTSSTTSPASRFRGYQHVVTPTTSSTPSASSPKLPNRVNTVANNPRGVPRLGLLEGPTWATIGPARRRGDRPERGSGAGAPTPPQG